ncbi:response regulator, partial [Streptomyces cacaoi]|uniref:response regulator n=1 Tax=Streptomyces cacaoi TaxID=1898 RepID=UPI000A397931
EVVGEAEDGRRAVAEVARLRPDVVLMDVRMPHMNGLEATREIVAADSGTKVLILTTYDLDEYVYRALRAGASGFLLKDAPPADLIAAVRVVAEGEALLAPSVTRRLIAEFARRQRPVRRASRASTHAARLKGLTERESEVLELVARGQSNGEIAETLVLAEQTVKTHVSRIFAKLDLRDRAQAVIFAYESGLIAPGDQ